jgi:hypothetical protein
MPVLATSFNDPDDSFVMAGIGTDGTNGWHGSYVTGAAFRLTLPMSVNLLNLTPNQELVVSMDAIIGTLDCGLNSGGGPTVCNEAYVGLSTPGDDAENLDGPHTISFGFAVERPTVGPWRTRFSALEVVESEEFCDSVGGRFVTAMHGGVDLMRCFFSGDGDDNISPWDTPDGEYFELSVHFTVGSNGDLMAGLYGGGTLVRDFNLGSVALRPWLGDMLASYFVDDTSDNLSVELLGDILGAPDTGFAPAEQPKSVQSRRVGWLDWLLGLFGL